MSKEKELTMLQEAVKEADELRLAASLVAAKKASLINRLRVRGLTFREIAEHVGLHTATVSGVVYRHKEMMK